MTGYQIKDDTTMTYLQWWRRPLTNLWIRIAAVCAILLGLQYLYMGHSLQAQTDDSARSDAITTEIQSISNTDSQMETFIATAAEAKS
jgi:hypothetical protein